MAAGAARSWAKVEAQFGPSTAIGLFKSAAAYPLSKSVRSFRSRTAYVWIIFFTMLFTGGLIPTYMLIRQLGMLDSIWALVLPPPFGVPVFNVLILLNFFRNIPAELEEAVKSAQIFIGALPILVVYPYLQRYFVKGMVLGSLKG